MTPEDFFKILRRKQYSIGHRLGAIGDSEAAPPFYNASIEKRKEGFKMKLKDYYSLIAKREGKKSQTSIGNIREIIKIENEVLSKATKIKNFLYKAIKKI